MIRKTVIHAVDAYDDWEKSWSSMCRIGQIPWVGHITNQVHGIINSPIPFFMKVRIEYEVKTSIASCIIISDILVNRSSI